MNSVSELFGRTKNTQDFSGGIKPGMNVMENLISGQLDVSSDTQVKFPDFDLLNGVSKNDSNPDVIGKAFKSAVDAIEAPQQEMNSRIVKFLEGREDIHNVMIAAEKAKFAVNFTVKVRDKIIDAYNTVMRMQM